MATRLNNIPRIMKYVIVRLADSWHSYETGDFINTPDMYYQAHEGDGYLKLTDDLKEAHVMDSNTAGSVLSLCRNMARGNFRYEIRSIS